MKARTSIIGTAMAAIMVLSAFPARAWDHPPYDRKIEEAVIRILQPKLGEIRGSLGLEPSGHIYPSLERRIGDDGWSPFSELAGRSERPQMARISWN